MHTLVLLLFLAVILGLLSLSAQKHLRRILKSNPGVIFAAPVLLTLLFCALAASAGALSPSLALLLLTYTVLPTLAAFVQGPATVGRPSWLDFATILMLWLPLEFSAGQHLIPKPAQGFLHSVAYGIAILLALLLFLGFRSLPGMKYNLPRPRDLALGVVGFALIAPVLVVVGRLLHFIPPFHAPAHPAPTALGQSFAAIFAGTALPEEILFRSLIQNWLMLRFGATLPVLLVAGLIFGAAHLDNGPQPLPNWRYMILATIAGVAYGKVFQKSSSVFSSVTFHALVDATKHFSSNRRHAMDRKQILIVSEVAAGFIFIMLYIWRLRFVWPKAWILILAFFVLSHILRGERSASLGFRWANFRECVELMAPALLLIALSLLSLGLLLQTMRPISLEYGCICLLAYCPWGVFQQYLVNGFIANRLAMVAAPRYVPLISASLFAGAHLPNWFLMIVTFAAGYCSTRLFMKYRNLYFLGLAHGVIGTLLFVVIPDSISHHLTVGPGFFLH